MPSVREVGSPADVSAPGRTHLPHVPASEHERRPRRVAPGRLRAGSGGRPVSRRSVSGSEAKRSGVAARAPQEQVDGPTGGRGRHRRRRGRGDPARFRFPGSCVLRASMERRSGSGRGMNPTPSGPRSASRGAARSRRTEGWRAARWRRYARQPAPRGAPGLAPGPRTRASTHARNCRFSSSTSAAAAGSPAGPGVRPPPPPPPSPPSGLPRFPSAGGISAARCETLSERL